MTVTESMTPNVAAANNLGTALKPFGDIFFGGTASKAADFDTSALSANRTVAIPDHASNTVQGIVNPSDTQAVNYIDTSGVQHRISTSSSSPLYKAEAATYQVLATDFSNPAPACGIINATTNTFTITLVASGSQPASGQCIDIFNIGGGYITVAASGQTLTYGNVTSAFYALVLGAGQGVEVVSDGANYWAQQIPAPTGGTSGNSVYGGSSLSGSATVRETILGTGIGNNSFTGYSNTLVGSTMAAALTSGASNVGVGYNSLGSLTSGSFNIGLGYAVGFGNMATGSDNLLIGYNGINYCDTPAADTSHYVCIENLLYGDSSKGIVGIIGPTTTLSSCGSPTLFTGSNDTAGAVTAGAVTACTVNFANTHGVAPFCTVTSRGGLLLSYTISTTQLVVSSASLSASTFDYHCFAGSTTANPAP
jgi:hypothetical protein